MRALILCFPGIQSQAGKGGRSPLLAFQSKSLAAKAFSELIRGLPLSQEMDFHSSALLFFSILSCTTAYRVACCKNTSCVPNHKLLLQLVYYINGVCISRAAIWQRQKKVTTFLTATFSSPLWVFYNFFCANCKQMLKTVKTMVTPLKHLRYVTSVAFVESVKCSLFHT